MRRARAVLGVLLASMLVVAVAGPASAHDKQSGTRKAAKVRVFHNSPDTPAVDIYVDGAKVLSNVSYGTLSPYLKVKRGYHRVQVKVAPSTKASPAALKAKVWLGRKATTIAAIGSLTGDGGELRLKVLRDKATRSKESTRVRVAHTSPDAPAVDIQAKLAGKWTPVIRNLKFGKASRYLRLPAGTYDLRVTAAGTNTVVKNLPDTKLSGRTSYTVWAVGFLTPKAGKPGFGIFVSTDG